MNELLEYLLDGWEIVSWRRYLKGNRVQVIIEYPVFDNVDFIASVDI